MVGTYHTTEIKVVVLLQSFKMLVPFKYLPTCIEDTTRSVVQGSLPKFAFSYVEVLP